jgi:hypothetical protein
VDIAGSRYLVKESCEQIRRSAEMAELRKATK